MERDLPIRKRSTTATKKGFNLNAKGYFVTFPKCDTPKEVARDRLIQHYGEELLWATIGQEHHQDGELHLHMCWMLKKQVHYRVPSCFDFIAGSHGNYQTMKHPLKAIKYCQKEDAAPLTIGTLPESTSKRQVSRIVATMVMDGASVSDVNDAEPGYVLTNLQKLQLYRTWVQNEKRRKTKEKWKECAYDVGALNLQEITIMEWINKNIKKPREFKQSQLVLEGGTNFRKTSLVNLLSKSLSILWMNCLEDFFQWEDGVYDLVVFDEWQANQHPIQFMNQFLDGQEMWVRIKQTQALKTERIPVIILTNFSIDLNFPVARMMERTTFLSRVVWVTLTCPLNLDMMMTQTGVPPEDLGTGLPAMNQIPMSTSTRSTDMGSSPRLPASSPVPPTVQCQNPSNFDHLYNPDYVCSDDSDEEATRLPDEYF